jgi:recombination protein RecT
MIAQTVTGAVAVRQKQDQAIARMLNWQADIAMAAASHVKPSAVIRVTQGALRRNPKLMEAAMANPQSLLYALLDCARLGHEPDTDDYYLVPFGSEVTGIEGYKGIIERMYRAGAVSSVVAEVVYQQDVYRRTGATTPPVHEYDEFADPADRGPLRGAYAYAVMLDGRFSKVIPMGRAEIMRHKAKSRGSDKSDSPWQQWPESMWKKCPLRGLEPYVPTSTEYRSALAAAVTQPERPANFTYLPPPPAHVSPASVVDVEIIDEPDGQTSPAETASNPVPEQEPPRPPSKAATEKLTRLLTQIPLGDDADRAVFIEWQTGHGIDAPLTRADVTNVTSFLEDALEHAGGSAEEAASQIWAQHQRATGQQQPEDGNHD